MKRTVIGFHAIIIANGEKIQHFIIYGVQKNIDRHLIHLLEDQYILGEMHCLSFLLTNRSNEIHKR